MERKERINDSIVEVARAFPFAFRTPQSILESLNKYIKNPDRRIPIIETFLAHKTDKSEFSANYLSPIGGKLLFGETAIKAAYRRIHEESTLVCSPLEERENRKFNIEGSFNYDIVAKTPNLNQKRRVHFCLVPVINPQIVTSIHPIQEDSKIDGFVGLSVEELTKAFISGKYIDMAGDTFPLQGHITKLNEKQTLDINLSKKNRENRRRLLNKATHTLEEQELKARSALYDNLISLAVIKMRFSAENFFIVLDNNVQKSDKKKQIEHMRKKSNKLEELMVVLKSTYGDKFDQLLIESYSKILGKFYMDYFRDKERKDSNISYKNKKPRLSYLNILKRKKEKSINTNLITRAEQIKKKMLEGNFSQDVLHYLPLYINIEGSVKGRTTRLIVQLARFIRDITKEIISEGQNKDLDSLGNYFMDEQILLGTKLKYYQKFDEQLTSVLGKVFQTDEKSIKDAWFLASRFIPNLADETKNADPKLSQLYQFHEIRNEIANSSLGQTLLLALGIDIKENGTDWPTLKFEALRQLTFFLKILFQKPLYENIVANKPHPIDLSINKFFGPITTSRIIILNENGKTKKMPISQRRSLSGDELIIDEKPVKSFISTVRKGLEESIKDIADIQSCAVVLPDNIYYHLKPNERIDFINQKADSFIEFMQTQYPSMDINIIEDKNTFDNLYAALKNEEVSEKGKRTGSLGDLLIRRKIKVRMIDKETNDIYNYELVFYPFEKLESNSFKEADNLDSKKLMGWKEKMEDDPLYSLRRIIFPLRGALGLKSIYELLFPPSIYPEIVEEMRLSNINIYKHI